MNWALGLVPCLTGEAQIAYMALRICLCYSKKPHRAAAAGPAQLTQVHGAQAAGM